MSVALLVPGEVIAGEPTAASRGEATGSRAGAAHARDAATHAGDRSAFEPGARVRAGFRPHPYDRSPVAGKAPVSLPAGRASGRAMLDGRSVRLAGRRAAAGVAAVRSVEARPTSVERPKTVGRSWPGDTTCRTRYPEPAPAERDRASRAEVFGYLPFWELREAYAGIDYRSLSTIAFFGIQADRTGRLETTTASGAPTAGWAGWNSRQMTTVLERAHARGVRVVLVIQRFAWTRGGTAATAELLTHPRRRARLAGEIVAAVRERGADGVDLDFEPMPVGLGDEYTAFVREMRAALDEQARGYQLTFTIPIERFEGEYDLPSLLADDAADAVFVMGYEYRDPDAGVVSSIAPLRTAGCSLTYSVRHLLALIPADRVILGLPYYGRSWPTVDGTAGGSVVPDPSTESGFSPSTVVLHESAVARARTLGRGYDRSQASARLAYREQRCAGCAFTWRQTYYDDLDALAEKYALVERAGLRGAGVWALGFEGGPELSMLLRVRFRDKRDATPPTGSVAVAGGRARTRSAFVTVDVPARDGIRGTGLAYVRVAAEPAVSHGVLTVARQFPYAQTVPWKLSGTDGSRPAPGRHRVYVQWRDVFGNWSSVHSDSIRYAP